MAASLRFFLILAAGTGCLAQPLDSKLLLLRHRAELAKDKKAFLLVDSESIEVFFKGFWVKTLPLQKREVVPPGRWRLTRIAGITPVEAPEGVVVHAREIAQDTLGSVSSPEEIVSVSDMPDSYMVQLQDGSEIMIIGEGSSGALYRFKSWLLQMRVVYSFLWHRMRRQPVRAVRLKMESNVARELFWLLRPEMGVIY